MLLRLACLTVTNAFTFLRLLPMTDREKDIEILALRLVFHVLHHGSYDEKAVAGAAVRGSRGQPEI